MNKKIGYNKYEDVEIKSFYDTYDVIELIDKKIKALDKDDDLAVYAKRDLISELFVNMIEDGYDFGYIDFDNLNDLLKDEIYLMTVGNNRRTNIEHAYENGRITKHESGLALFYTDDCKQDIIDYCIDNDMEVILFDFEDDEGYCNSDCSCIYKCKCEGDGGCRKECKNRNESQNTYESESATVTVSKSKSGTPNGFTKSWYNDEEGAFSSTTYSFYSKDIKLLQDMAEEFGVKL